MGCHLCSAQGAVWRFGSCSRHHSHGHGGCQPVTRWSKSCLFTSCYSKSLPASPPFSATVYFLHLYLAPPSFSGNERALPLDFSACFFFFSSSSLSSKHTLVLHYSMCSAGCSIKNVHVHKIKNRGNFKADSTRVRNAGFVFTVVPSRISILYMRFCVLFSSA